MLLLINMKNSIISINLDGQYLDGQYLDGQYLDVNTYHFYDGHVQLHLNFMDLHLLKKHINLKLLVTLATNKIKTNCINNNILFNILFILI